MMNYWVQAVDRNRRGTGGRDLGTVRGPARVKATNNPRILILKTLASDETRSLQPRAEGSHGLHLSKEPGATK